MALSVFIIIICVICVLLYLGGYFLRVTLQVCVNAQARGIKGLRLAGLRIKIHLKKRHVKQLVRIIAIMHQPLILLTP